MNIIIETRNQDYRIDLYQLSEFCDRVYSEIVDNNMIITLTKIRTGINFADIETIIKDCFNIKCKIIANLINDNADLLIELGG